MKLYNVFESVILEEIEKQRKLITEGVSMDDVKAAIDGKYNGNCITESAGILIVVLAVP